MSREYKVLLGMILIATSILSGLMTQAIEKITMLENKVTSYDTVTSKTLPITWNLIQRERGPK